MEPAEAVEKLRLAIRVLANFKQFYFEYRSKSLAEASDNPWKFQNSSLFQRLDGYLERSHDMMDMMITCTQFNKLERVEIGGTKGRVLTNGIKAIHADFTAAVERFKVSEGGVRGAAGVGSARRREVGIAVPQSRAAAVVTAFLFSPLLSSPSPGGGI